MSVSYFIENRTCTPKCKSSQHAYELISFMTKTNDTQLLLSALQKCWNCQKIHDVYGRYIIHMAACCGRIDVIEWLIKYKKADINVKTFENGWSPAQCASFYGQIGALVMLIKNGASLSQVDYDRMSCIDQLQYDNWYSTKDESNSLQDSFDVYTWGNNINFTLGHYNQIEKPYADVVEYFKMSNISIVQIVMSKFHTIFRDSKGKVYTCGHGKDGRLGHNNEETYVMPTIVNSLKNEKCIHVAASLNNSYFLMEGSIVKSCGTNEFKQLGQIGEVKSLTPKPFNMKSLKNMKIEQIECGRFHCALLTSSNEVYTFGLNAGQLGHANELNANATAEYNNSVCYIQEPRLIKDLSKVKAQIETICCSDGATVCLDKTNKKHLYLCYEYKCQHIKTPFQGICKKMRVYGGKLDHHANNRVLGSELGDSLFLVCLIEPNLLYVWRENESWKLINWTGNKQLHISDYEIFKTGLIVSTVEGTCYIGAYTKSGTKNLTIKSRIRASNSINIENSEMHSSPITVPKSQSGEFEFIQKIELVDIHPVPFVNRCFLVACDTKGQNFSALQYLPNLKMKMYPSEDASLIKSEFNEFFNETNSNQDQNSTHHDIVIIFKSRKFYLHKYILLTRCNKYFMKLDVLTKHQLVLDEHVPKTTTFEQFQLLIQLIYSNHCSVDKINNAFKAHNVHNLTTFIKFCNTFKELAIERFHLTDAKRPLDDLISNLKSSEKSNSKLSESFETCFQVFCKMCKKVRYDRSSFPELYDCEIECNKDVIIKCHKCIIIARSEYFRNMFLGYWIESDLNRVKLPFDDDLMQIIIDYLYTDEIILHLNDKTLNEDMNLKQHQKAKIDKEIEILFNLYILSDQLLLPRIKNSCEFKLANIVNLKNVIEIFEFSVNYEAKQLHEFCMEYICNNIVTLLDAKALDHLNSDNLSAISEFYTTYFNHVGSRKITPYGDGLDLDSIEIVPDEFLYDQKFIDGTGYDDDASRKRSNNSLSIDNEPQSRSVVCLKETVENSINENKPQVEIEIDDIELNTEKKTDNEKWNKVRKKNRKKQTETKEKQEQPIISPITLGKTSTVIANDKSISTVSTSGGEKFLKCSVDIKKQDVVKSPQTPSRPIAFTPISPPNNKIINKTDVVWGGTSVTKPATPNLLDVINEEMNKMVINKSIKKIEKSIEPEKIYNSPPKGWNMQSVVQPKESKSIAQIIEMEKTSKEQYRKLTSRNMDLIQLEEKAIEDLKRLYNADDSSDMIITVELMQDADISVLSNCTPVWKK